MSLPATETGIGGVSRNALHDHGNQPHYGSVRLSGCGTPTSPISGGFTHRVIIVEEGGRRCSCREALALRARIPWHLAH